MKHLRQFIFRSLVRRPVRSIALLLLSAVLFTVLFAGTCVIRSLDRGLAVMEDRLGADIMVVPYAALSRKNFDNTPLLGNAGDFHIPAQSALKIAGTEGIRRISTQYYVTEAEIPACEAPVHLMVYDPETDFVVTPWIEEKVQGTSGDLPGVTVGSGIDLEPGDILSLFDTQLRVGAKLERSDTELDTTVFFDRKTLQEIAESSGDEKLKACADEESEGAVSTVLLDVAEDYDVESVKNDINIHVKKIRALSSQNVLSGTASGMRGIASAVRMLMAGVWIVAAGIMTAALFMMTSERRREFAVLRVLGASGGKVTGIVVGEGLALSAAGAAAGILLCAPAAFAGSGWIRSWLNLPPAFPPADETVLYAALAMLLCMLTGCAAAAVPAVRISAQDTGTIIRSEE